MKKNILCSLLALLFLLCLAVPAGAEEFTGEDGWEVEYNGEKIVSSFASVDILRSIPPIQPGDQISLSVTLNNTGSDPANWYMTNEVLQSLEDSQDVAGGGVYSYRLSYRNEKGEENVLFDSDSVGGEGEDQGLHAADSSLNEYFYLDTMSGGKSGTVNLSVALDGETQGNTYQDTLAKLQLNFAAEKADPTAPQPSPGATATTTTAVKTGDESHLLFWAVLMACSGALVVILLVLARKSRKKEDDVHE